MKAEIVIIYDEPFLHIVDEKGPRIIRVACINSIVPNYSIGGSMIFIASTGNKAISVEQTPEEILAAIGQTTNE